MTPELRKFRLISTPLLGAMVVCGVLSLSSFHFHRDGFRVAADILMLLNAWVIIRFNRNKRQPDTLIHLFPQPSETAKERP